MQADDPLRSATRVDTVASYGQLRPVVSVAVDADVDPLAAGADGMTSIDLDQPAAGATGGRRGSSGDAPDASSGMSGASNRRAPRCTLASILIPTDVSQAAAGWELHARHTLP